MNRFYTDPANWIGPTHLGSIHNPDTSVSKFLFDGPEGSPVAKLKSAYASSVEAVSSLGAKRKEVEAKGHYTPLGIVEKVAEHAGTDELPAVRRARKVVENVYSDIASRRSSLKLAEPTEAERKGFEELRSVMRGMDPKTRDKFVQQNRSNPAVVRAIATTAIPALVGVDPLVHQHIIDEQMEREHGETVAELRDLEEVARVVDKVSRVARDQLRETIGCSEDIFEKVAKVAEANDGELPLKIETQVVDGKPQEVARVFDYTAKRWRDALPTEIRGAA
jgi:hypothetical protein